MYCNVLYLLLCGHQLVLAAHVHSERFGDRYCAVAVEVVLEESDEHSGRCYNGVVKGVCKVLAAVLALNSYLESSCLSIAQIRAGTYLEVLLLSGAPCLNVAALYLQVSQVARALHDR